MKRCGFGLRILLFFRNVFIMTIITMTGVFLISILTDSNTSESYGRMTIISGCLYMLLGVGSLIGDTNLRYGVSHLSCFNNLNANQIKGFAAGEISKIDRSFVFTLHSAFTGSVILIIGIIIYNGYINNLFFK